MRVIVTVVGGDKVGIIYKVTKVAFENNVNILDINQTVMDGDVFTMMMMVDIEGMTCGFEDLIAAYDEVGAELGVSIHVQREDVFNAMHSI